MTRNSHMVKEMQSASTCTGRIKGGDGATVTSPIGVGLLEASSLAIWTLPSCSFVPQVTIFGREGEAD